VNAVIAAAAELQAVCEAERWRYCIIGGLALQRWGEARETVDVDLTLLTGFGDEGRFIARLTSAFEARIDDASAFALANRVLLLRTTSGVGLDVAFGGLPFEARAIERSSIFRFPPDVPLRTCSAEDLIVLKAFADRPRDWADIEGVLIRQAGSLDWASVRDELAPLLELKEAPELLDRLEQLRRRIGA
jgi:Nucleotidyl transferase AbiEii toxin, Type IV TA system